MVQTVDRVQHVFQVRLGQQPQALSPDLQTLRPQLDLPLGLLAGYIQHRRKPAQAVADLEHEGGFADARRAAHQHQGTPHRAAAQHPVQLAHAGGEAKLLGHVHLGHGLGLVQGDAAHGRGGPAAPAGRGTLRRTLHDRVPGPAGGAFALPLGGLVAAFCAVEKCFGFHRKLLDKIGWGFYNIRRRTLSLVSAGRRPTLQVYSLKLPLLYFYRWGAVISLYSCPKKQPQS